MPNKDSKRLPIQKRTSAQVLVLGRLALNPFLDFCRECWALEQCTVLGRNVCPCKNSGEPPSSRSHDTQRFLPDKFIGTINSLGSDYSAVSHLRVAH
jgi:hypothetical protein